MSTLYRERRGAHRPAGIGPAGYLPWVLAAIAVLAIVVFVSGWFDGPDDGAPKSVVNPAVTSSTPSHSASSPSSSGSTPAQAPTTPSQTTAQADRTLPVTVLNSTSRAGLAAGAANKLKAAGWTIRSTGNYRSLTGKTTVYYGKASLRATAQAIASDLGGATQVAESADWGSARVTVVLGPDYQ